MEKQFVSYAVAKILKAKGFNEECFGFFDHNIRSKKPIKPVMEIKYNQKTGVPDTTYVYVRP